MAKYKSIHTGQEIDDAVSKIKDEDLLTLQEADNQYLIKNKHMDSVQSVYGDIYVYRNTGETGGVGLDWNGLHTVQGQLDVHGLKLESLYGGNIQIIADGILTDGNGNEQKNRVYVTGKDGVFISSLDNGTTISIGASDQKGAVRISKNGTNGTINGVGTPELDFDAANKKYVDDSIQSIVGDISVILDQINGEVA